MEHIALEQCYRQYAHIMIGMLQKKLFDTFKAEELVHDAFLKALQKHPDKPKEWLFVVAKNNLTDTIRREINEKKCLIEYGMINNSGTFFKRQHDAKFSHIETTLRSQFQTYDADELPDEILPVALTKLSNAEQKILKLWSENLDYKEISKETGLAVGAIGTTLSRAKKKLRSEYFALDK